MGKASGKTDKIKAALAKGTPVMDVARKYEVTPAYVYTLRKRMNVQPTRKPARKPAKRPTAKPALMMPLVSPQPLEVQVAAPAVTVVAPPPPPPMSRWQRIKSFFRGAR